jgi:hypothetical protein
MSLSISDIEREINKAKITLKNFKKKYEETNNKKYLTSINTISEEVRNKNKELYILKKNNNNSNNDSNISFTEIENILDNKILELKPTDSCTNTENIEILKLKSLVKPNNSIIESSNNMTNVTNIKIKKITTKESQTISEMEFRRLNKLYDSLKI